MRKFKIPKQYRAINKTIRFPEDVIVGVAAGVARDNLRYLYA